jgi:hypothetical protein
MNDLIRHNCDCNDLDKVLWHCKNLATSKME